MRCLKCLLITLFLCTWNLSQAASTSLRILSFNDVYEVEPIDDKGGLAEMASLLQKFRSWNSHNITTVSGDFIGGSFSGRLFKGAEMIEIFNELKVDFVTFGNHEFDWGPEVLAKRMHESHFTWLGSNVIGRDGKPYGGAKETVILEFDGIKVGLMGLCRESAKYSSKPMDEIQFLPIIETAKEMTKKLKQQGADVIIAITHLTIDEDRHLASEVPEISLIVGGDEHVVELFEEENAYIIKAGTDAHHLAVIDIQIEKSDNKEKPRIKTWSKFSIEPNSRMQPDPAVQEIIRSYNAKVDEKFNLVIGHLVVELDGRSKIVQTKETAIGNLIADAMKAVSGADLAIINSGAIRGERTYPAGVKWTLKDLITVLPYDNKLLLIEVSGEDLQKTLEQGLSQVNHGGFPQVSGMNILWDKNLPKGKRIVDLRIGNESVDPRKKYKLAVNNFLYEGGDGYTYLEKAKRLSSEENEFFLVDAVIEYLKSTGSIINSKVDGRLKQVRNQ